MAKLSGISHGSGSISSTMLERLRLRDGEAWRQLVHVFGPVVYQWCRRRGLQPSDSADTVQEVFASVASKLDEFHRSSPGHTFRGWVWTVARNKILDHFRRGATRPTAPGGTDANRRLQELPDSDLIEIDERSAVDAQRLITQRALEVIRGDFDEKTWRAFWRMAVDGHSSAEIAADLGMTKDAVRQGKYRVLRRLREELERLL
ncbi:MAG: sigma-70 family RNA polymerase sigma factor [Planctomycetota bacterium]